MREIRGTVGENRDRLVAWGWCGGNAYLLSFSFQLMLGCRSPRYEDWKWYQGTSKGREKVFLALCFDLSLWFRPYPDDNRV